MSEKFSLKWNDYQSNWNKTINDLRKDTDLADVTLISDDKVKFSAHKILISSCSNIRQSKDHAIFDVKNHYMIEYNKYI